MPTDVTCCDTTCPEAPDPTINNYSRDGDDLVVDSTSDAMVWPADNKTFVLSGTPATNAEVIVTDNGQVLELNVDYTFSVVGADTHLVMTNARGGGAAQHRIVARYYE